LRRLTWVLSGVLGFAVLAGWLVWANYTVVAVRDVPVLTCPGGPLAPARSAGECQGSVAEGAVSAPSVLGNVTVYTTSVTLPTVPYTRCLSAPRTGVAGVSYQVLDWTCLSQTGPPVSHTYTLLVLSNDYLTVTLLPELGGRVYELIFKPTGHNELYRNPVIKPTPFGPVEQGWWLGVGGMEWGFPTDEHGYEWGVPWHYRVVTSTAGVTVTLRDSQTLTRPYVSIAVHLPVDQALLFVRPQIVNPGVTKDKIDVGVKYWTNAMLAPGGANAPAADLRFVFPSEQVIVHSTGDADLPAAGELMDWPVHNGRDYGRLGNWRQWLGFFEAPQAHGPFVGVYDMAADEGVVRVYPADVARGSKGFAFGWHDPLPSWLWTDDGSSYVELHGGLAPTFWDTVTLSMPVVSWTEVWYPLFGIGGLDVAEEGAALRFTARPPAREDKRGSTGDALTIGVYTPAAHEYVDLYLWQDDCSPVGYWRLPQMDPFHPVTLTLPAESLDIGQTAVERLSLVALSADGTFLAGVNPRDCLAPTAGIDALPFYVTSLTFTVAWHGQDVWSGVDTFDVQMREGYAGRWTDWLTSTRSLSATFAGRGGETYFFRTRAQDLWGNAGIYGDDEWGQAFTSVLLQPAPVLLTSRKWVDSASPMPGQSLHYTVLLSNTGNLVANLTLTDDLPETFTTLNPPGTYYGTFYGRQWVWRGELPSGETLSWRFTLTPTAATPLGVPLTNTIRLVADGCVPLTRQVSVLYRHLLYLPFLSKK